MREELAAFSPAFRGALAEAGLDPHQITGPALLARLAPLSRADLAGDGRAHLLALDPRAIRERWSGLRKLALGLGGRRVRAALPRSYRPALRLETRGRSGEPLGVWLTAFDLEVARELGRRNLEILGLDPGSSRALALVGGGTDLASWQMRAALEAAAVPAACVPPPRGARAAAALRAIRALRPTVVLGAPADLLRLGRAARAAGVELAGLELAVLLAEPADLELRRRIARELAAAGAPAQPLLAAAYGLAELRTLLVECPTPAGEPTGLHLFPDAVLAQVEGAETGAEEGAESAPELLLTPLVGHGTALWRYRTGDRVPGPATWAPCPACGRGLPRIGPILGRLDEDVDLGPARGPAFRPALEPGPKLELGRLRARLDGRAEILEWQLLVRRPAGRERGPAEGLVLRVALAPGASAQTLARELAAQPMGAGALPELELRLHSEREMLDFLATPHEMLERRLLDPAAATQP